MYDNVKYMGRSLVEWCGILHNEFTPGHLYRLVKAGKKIEHLAIQLRKSRV